jgi:hypothetical protein
MQNIQMRQKKSNFKYAKYMRNIQLYQNYSLNTLNI